MSVPAPSNLLLWYKFDEDSGTSALDSSNRGFDGTYTGSPVLGNRGRINKGVSLNGSSDYISVPNTIGDSNISALTISAWVRPINISTSFLMMYSQFSTATSRIELCQAGNPVGQPTDILFILSNGSSVNCYTNGLALLSQNIWGHWCAVFNGNGSTDNDKLQIYFNSVRMPVTIDTTPPSLTPNIPTTTRNIGRRNNNTLYHHGMIDDFMMWNTNLNPLQITQLYSRVKPKGLING